MNQVNDYFPNDGKDSNVWNKLPFVTWFNNKKKTKASIRNKAAKAVTNRMAANTATFADALDAISFDYPESRLPESALNKKDFKQDLKKFTKGLAKYIRDNSSEVPPYDIKSIDEKIMQIIYAFEDAVKAGDVQTVNTARIALDQAFWYIRNKIPSNMDKERLKRFNQCNADHLEDWITCIEMAKGVDELEREKSYREKEYNYKLNTEVDKIKKELKEIADDDQKTFNLDYIIMNGNTKAERSKFTKEQKQIYHFLVEAFYTRFLLEKESFLYFQTEASLRTASTELKSLKQDLGNTVPSIVDPNLSKKVDDIHQKRIDRMAQREQENEKALTKVMEEQEKLQRLWESPYKKKEMAAAVKTGKELVEEMTSVENDVNLSEAAKNIRNKWKISNEEKEKEKESNEEITVDEESQEENRITEDDDDGDDDE